MVFLRAESCFLVLLGMCQNWWCLRMSLSVGITDRRWMIDPSGHRMPSLLSSADGLFDLLTALRCMAERKRWLLVPLEVLRFEGCGPVRSFEFGILGLKVRLCGEAKRVCCVDAYNNSKSHIHFGVDLVVSILIKFDGEREIELVKTGMNRRSCSEQELWGCSRSRED